MSSDLYEIQSARKLEFEDQVGAKMNLSDQGLRRRQNQVHSQSSLFDIRDELEEWEREAIRDRHEDNIQNSPLDSVIETEHGHYKVSALVKALKEYKESDREIYHTRETLGFDIGGTPVFVKEQQHLIELVPLDKRLPPYTGKWIMFAIQILWIMLLWLGVVGTIYMDGFDSYSHYFTNWMWTINTVFYTVDALTFLDITGRAQFLWVAWVFWPVYANIAQVFWLVFIMICDNPDVIGEPAEEYGFCPVLLVDRLKHVIPFVVINIYAMLRKHDLVIVLRTVGVRGWKSVAAYIVLQFIFAHLILFGYWSNFDFYSVYGLSLNVWAGLFIVEFLYLMWLIIPIVLLSPYLERFWTELQRSGHRFELRFSVDAKTPKNSNNGSNS